jgi:DNA-binding NarL/FixJ family response regulator
MAHIGRYAPTDIRMPGLDGLAATTVICADPDLASTRIPILTTFELDDYVARAIRAAASGFLGQDVGADSLLAGIRTAAVGDALLPPQATGLMISRFLTTDEPADRTGGVEGSKEKGRATARAAIEAMLRGNAAARLGLTGRTAASSTRRDRVDMVSGTN